MDNGVADHVYVGTAGYEEWEHSQRDSMGCPQNPAPKSYKLDKFMWHRGYDERFCISKDNGFKSLG